MAEELKDNNPEMPEDQVMDVDMDPIEQMKVLEQLRQI